MLQDHEQRLIAKYNFESNIFVEAGAGTGKTRLLTERIANWLLLSEKGDITRLVALTFTEKAAAEIKIRVLKQLEKVFDVLSNALPDEDGYVETMLVSYGKTKEELIDRINHARDNIEHSRISTIHAFALFLLRLYPLEADLSPSVLPDPGENAVLVFDRSWKQWLEVELGEAAVREDKWREILKHTDINALEEFAKELCFNARAGKDPSLLLKTGIEYARSKAKRAMSLYEEFTFESKPLKLENTLKEINIYLKAVAEALESGAPVLPEDGKWTKPSVTKKWQEHPDKFKEALDLIKYANNISANSQQIINKAHALLSDFVQIFKINFRKANYISFEEILIKARDLVKNNQAVRQEIKNSFDFILIDEFQDTDPLQGELLFFISERKDSLAANWTEVVLQNGKLFVVGDPKQSIYRFRGADILAYDRFKEYIIKQGGIFLNILVNFRSLDNIVSFINNSLPCVMKEDFGVQPKYVPIYANKQAADKKEAVSLITIESDAKILADSSRFNQAGAVADWIYENCIASNNFKLKDIAVLTRKKEIFEHFISVFKMRGIKYSVEDDKLFYTASEVLDFISLLKLIDNPYDNIAFTAVLRSPLCMVKDERLLQLANENKLNVFSDFDGGELNGFAEKIKKFADLSCRIPLPEFLEEAANAFNIRGLLSHYYNGEQSLFNVNKFIELSKFTDSNPVSSLTDFLAQSQLYVSGIREEGESPVIDEHLDAVNILTIHKSKGLEFDVVILPELNVSLSAKNRGETKVMYSWQDDLPSYRLGKFSDINMAAASDREIKHAQAEEIRIFYVALTRAKKKLVLVATTNKHEAGSMAEFLAGSGIKLKTFGEIKPELTNAQIAFAAVPLKTQQQIMAAKAAAGDGINFENFDKDLWLNNIKAKENEYSQYKKRRSFIKPSAEHEIDYDEDAVVTDNSYAKLVGLITHKFFEVHNFKEPVTLDTVRAYGFEYSLLSDAGQYNKAVAEAYNIIISFSKTQLYKELASFPFKGREISFVAQDCSGAVVRGIIDSITEENGALVINDYKTDKIAKGGEAKAAEKYRGQCLLYKQAAEKMFPANKVLCRVIFIRTGVAAYVNFK